MGYIFIVKDKGYEYITDSLVYIINEIIILSAMYLLLIVSNKNKIKNVIVSIICVILTIINMAFMCNDGIENKSIVSFSKGFANELVLKQNKETGAINFYRSKYVLFARKDEQFSEESSGKIKVQWITSDICGVTYNNAKGELREFVATYGYRGENLSYYNVALTLGGSWQVFKRFKYLPKRK